MRAFRLFSAGILLATLSIPAQALAQKSADAARAEALFEEGRKLMSGGDYAAACPKFADSQTLDPAPGTALNLAACYEKAGKLASAWAAYKTAQASAEAAGQRPRAEAAKKKAAALEAQLSRLTITVPAPARVQGLEVRVDREAVHEGEWGVAVPRDGGGHDVEAVAPGKKGWTRHVDLKPSGQTLEVEVPTLEDAPAPAAGTQPGAPATAPDVAPLPPPPPGAFAETPEHPGKTQRLIGLVVGGVGVAGLAFGAIAGIEAASNYSTAKSQCGPTPPVCQTSDSPAFGTRSTAVTWATLSTVGFVAGGVLAAGGAVLFFTAPKDSSQPKLGIATATQGTGLSVLGTF